MILLHNNKFVIFIYKNKIMIKYAINMIVFIIEILFLE